MGKSNITHSSHNQSSRQDLVLSVKFVGSSALHWFIDFPPTILYSDAYWFSLEVADLVAHLSEQPAPSAAEWCQWAAPSPPVLLTLMIACLPFHRVSSVFLCPSFHTIAEFFYFTFKKYFMMSLICQVIALFAKLFSIIFSTLLYLFAENKKKKLARNGCKMLLGLDESPSCP